MINPIFKRTVSLFLSAFLLTASLAGCQNDTKKTEEEHQPLTIVSFNNLITQDFIDAFQKEYPEVQLDIISYAGMNGSGYAQYSLKHGDIPDIYVTSQSFEREAQEKYLLDLSNYDFVNHYSTALLDTLDINGNIYLLPSGYQLTGIYYNKTILKENHWEVPKSFQEFTALSKKIEAAGYQTMGHGMSLDGYPFNYFFNIGNTMYFGTPQGTEWKNDFPKGEAKAVGNKELERTVQYFNKWVENGFITTKHMEVEQFFEGECVFYLCLGLNQYENTTKEGKIYEFGTIPWLSEDGSNNMLTRTVSRYMGINQKLADKGQEQKLEDALKLLHYISTAEGQKALMSSSNQYMSSLNESTLLEDGPYQELENMVKEGRTVPLVYVGWEKQIIPIAQDIKKLIDKEMDAKQLLEAFDNTNQALLNGSSDDVFAVADETLTLEQTAHLVAAAEGKAVDADCAMISLNQYHGDGLCNNQGVAHYIYKGDISTEVINMFRPRADTITVLEMTGAEIKKMQAAGFDLDKNGKPYEYLLFTKGGMKLEDTATYKLAISTGELEEDRAAGAIEREISPREAIGEYLRELGHVNGDEIEWK